ncbi:MAG: ABC transporter ATP-binding protein [Gammaproteobacteria bacterium]|nr:ABC transporter ATP-binding protein [Gammaproteobacteria bacterium]
MGKPSQLIETIRTLDAKNDDCAIELIDVCKSYGPQNVLDGACLRIAAAEFVAVMGRSGSGKSTLLKLIGGLASADSGSIRHGAHELTTMDESERTLFRRRELGFVFQFFNLVPTLTVTENVLLPLALNRIDEAAGQARARELLERLGLGACAGRLPDELSGGEQQRVAIARALAHAPRLVITDEPTGNLDADTADEVMDLLATTCREHGATLIVATHSRAAAALADRTLHIRGGRIESAR